MGNRSENMEDEFASRGGRVDLLFEADQMNAAGLEVIDGFQQFLERAAKPVETRDGQAVAGTSVIKGSVPAGGGMTP